MTHIGEDGTEQFTITTRVDGKVIQDQKIHDPFLHSKTIVGMSRWDLFKALFRRQFEIRVEISVRGTEGIMRRIMTMDPTEVAKETEAILTARSVNRFDVAYHNAFTARQS